MLNRSAYGLPPLNPQRLQQEVTRVFYEKLAWRRQCRDAQIVVAPDDPSIAARIDCAAAGSTKAASVEPATPNTVVNTAAQPAPSDFSRRTSASLPVITDETAPVQGDGRPPTPRTPENLKRKQRGKDKNKLESIEDYQRLMDRYFGKDSEFSD